MAASINFVTVSSTLTFWNVSTIFKGCRAPQAVCCIRKFTGNGIPVKPDCTELDKDGFRIYRIPGLHKTKSTAVSRKSEMRPQPVPREKRININTDWTHVWPTAATFKPSVVPLPIRQGYIKNAGENQGLTPGKYHNLELMKVTNFLHLTPRHISKHCAAIKKFCTPWPKALNDSEFRENHFPLSITTQDYVFSGPSIRDPRSRAVTMTFSIDKLDLDTHAKDKMIRLLGDRYNVETGEVTIQTDSCPSRLQNTDYAKYLLTALYFESWKVEDWESEITWADLKTYEYDKSSNKVKVEAIVEQLPHAKDDKWKKSSLKKYEEAISNLHNQGESQETLTQYKRAVMNLLKLKTDFQ